MIDPGPVTPIIIKVVPPATPEVTVVDIVLNSLGLTGAILIGSLLLGGMLGLLFIWISRRRRERGNEKDSDAVELRLNAPPR